ncbi:hypothetical protein KBC54_04920 [Patescibacteria group bacterium]|nr:hypothetical protein [Patescibacteria group bacterium]
MAHYLRVVPAVRTISGVEAFDYAIPDSASLHIGDVLFVPFRKKQIAAIVIDLMETSPYAEKCVMLTDTTPLLRLHPTTAELLIQTAQRTWCSAPTIFASWIRQIPKRATPIAAPVTSEQPQTAERQTTYRVDRWHGDGGLIATAQRLTGRTIVFTPWKIQAEHLAAELSAPLFHSELATGAAWKTVTKFLTSETPIIVTTRIGSWLASQAEHIIIDEPENDDWKQDEASPRIDTRWLIEEIGRLRPEVSIIKFSTTPPLSNATIEWKDIPDVQLNWRADPWQRRSFSTVDQVSALTLTQIHEAIEDKRPVIILHPIRGERARIACKDCGWVAACASCGFQVSLIAGKSLCRRCGKRDTPPNECKNCSGYNLSAGRSGIDHIRQQLDTQIIANKVQIVDTHTFQTMIIPPNAFIVCTDLSLTSGAIEDIRRKEKFTISWRRIASKITCAGAQLVAQGPEELLTEAHALLTAEGVRQTWKQEWQDRGIFGYPPTFQLIKCLVDGIEAIAQTATTDLTTAMTAIPGVHVRGPFPVPFRAASRGARWVIHIIAPLATTEERLDTILKPFSKKMIIDRDPIAFFS